MNKLIEFLHDPEAKGLILGNNGFRAERIVKDVIYIWCEGKVLCKITPDLIQHNLNILPPENVVDCNCLNELFILLGMPSLHVKWFGFGKRAYIQRMRDGLPVAEHPLRDGYTLKVTV